MAAKKKTSASKSAARRPIAAEENAFWSAIEAAWAPAGEAANAGRRALASRDPDGEDPDTAPVDGALEGVVARLRSHLESLDAEVLTAFDLVLERKLYDIDRQEIQEVTDGSDDGFMYARGFIVALGKKFYDAVDADPTMAICDAECGAICYLPAHVHEARFGSWPETSSGISRESCSNRKGWPE
jgi:hypothetical protein